jgi:hypothetical protein
MLMPPVDSVVGEFSATGLDQFVPFQVAISGVYVSAVMS